MASCRKPVVEQIYQQMVLPMKHAKATEIVCQATSYIFRMAIKGHADRVRESNRPFRLAIQLSWSDWLNDTN